METNLIVEAFKFMLLGMGIVFSFLVVMIYALKLQAKVVGKYFPDKKVESANQSTTTQSASNNSNKIAAIVAAVQHHKNLKG